METNHTEEILLGAFSEVPDSRNFTIKSTVLLTYWLLQFLLQSVEQTHGMRSKTGEIQTWNV